MMRRTRNLLIMIGVVALSLVLVREFLSELFALAWHVRHGKTTLLKSQDGRTYKVEVPTLWWPDVHERGWELSLTKMAGPIRTSLRQSKWAMISFSVTPANSTAEELRRGAPILSEKLGVRTTEVAAFSAAGHDLHCFEREHGARRAETGKGSPDYDLVQLTCAPLSDKQGFFASYMGTRGLVPEFYQLVKSVKRIEQ